MRLLLVFVQYTWQEKYIQSSYTVLYDREREWDAGLNISKAVARVLAPIPPYVLYGDQLHMRTSAGQ